MSAPSGCRRVFPPASGRRCAPYGAPRRRSARSPTACSRDRCIPSWLVRNSSLIDDRGAPVPRGHVGELILRGPNVTIGYWTGPGRIDGVGKDGWYHTGDLMRQDEKGDLWFVSRKKDLIIRGGSNIAPAEVERVLIGHPAVRDAGVVGVPDAVLGQRVAGFVQLANGAQSVTAGEILADISGSWRITSSRRASSSPIRFPAIPWARSTAAGCCRCCRPIRRRGRLCSGLRGGAGDDHAPDPSRSRLGPPIDEQHVDDPPVDDPPRRARPGSRFLRPAPGQPCTNLWDRRSCRRIGAIGKRPAGSMRRTSLCLLAHDGGTDPRFIYANNAAQSCFEYDWAEMTSLRSRFSAGPSDREERQRLLDAVSRQGFHIRLPRHANRQIGAALLDRECDGLGAHRRGRTPARAGGGVPSVARCLTLRLPIPL